jgi:hypothetical protein
MTKIKREAWDSMVASMVPSKFDHIVGRLWMAILPALSVAGAIYLKLWYVIVALVVMAMYGASMMQYIVLVRKKAALAQFKDQFEPHDEPETPAGEIGEKPMVTNMDDEAKVVEAMQGRRMTVNLTPKQLQEMLANTILTKRKVPIYAGAHFSTMLTAFTKVEECDEGRKVSIEGYRLEIVIRGEEGERV